MPDVISIMFNFVAGFMRGVTVWTLLLMLYMYVTIAAIVIVVVILLLALLLMPFMLLF